jgi:glycosyltransferase involved in cell wall biosynthesis
VQKFCPSAALVEGWIRYARILAGAVKKQGAPVIATSDVMDRRTLRQRMFPLYHRLVLRRLHDYYWVPGEKAREYLIQNGISSKTIWKGLYSPDIKAFRKACILRQQKYTAWPKTFLFVGQYIDRKGVPELLDAFERAGTDYNLLMCGQGPLKEMVDEYAHRLGNISDIGFVQPEQLPRVMAQACALVLPSREDNWGLVILEAAASGLPIICSDACGAAYDLLVEGKNGYTIPACNTEALVVALQKVASLSDQTLEKMSQESLELASHYSPSKWASYLYHKLTEVLPHDT